jgi:hypothetical protein|tara:strand:+ start:176 stop:529 length:354 start_codon:yes stop_codon:yes gene_type:complete
MDNKTLLISNVKKWLTLDNEIRALQKEINIRKQEKKEITNDLIDIMKTSDLDTIEIKDGNINYVKRNVKKAITKKYLISVLNNYFQGDLEKVSELNTLIMDNRENDVRETIQRHINK